MKNSRRKIIAAVVCGMVMGSVGTSYVGKFQTASTNSAVTSSIDNSSNNHVGYDDRSEGFKGQRGDGEGKGDRHKGEASIDQTTGVDVAGCAYNDGTYTGTASGYANNLKVQVDISGGKITNVEVVSHNETPGFCEKAFDKVPAEIVAAQSTNVDTASGATYSSVGIINAVNAALESAKA